MVDCNIQFQVLVANLIMNLKVLPMKEGNGLFNDALNTLYLRLFMDHSNSERGKPTATKWATLSD